MSPDRPQYLFQDHGMVSLQGLAVKLTPKMPIGGVQYLHGYYDPFHQRLINAKIPLLLCSGAI
jgi:hypothetical protein